MTEGLQWWGYLHSNGTVQVKRYFDTLYRQDCEESEFVVAFTNPFEAATRADAIEIVREKLITKRKLKPGHYEAVIKEIIIKENGDIDLDFIVNGLTLRFNIHKENRNGKS